MHDAMALRLARGMQMLVQGGAPIDAAIAAQMVLGLVEPQSSGLGRRLAADGLGPGPPAPEQL